MASPDVLKIRLSADGIQDVVNAMKKVQTETQKTAKAGLDAGAALGSLGTIFAAQRLAAFASSALDAAEALYKMSQKTGVSVEQLSVLTFQATQAAIPQEALEKGMIKLAKSFVSLESGGSTAVEAFKKIGLSAADLKGLSLDQVMLKLANAQAKYADGAGKAATMTELMGKSGANMIPLLNEMAGGGFEAATEHLQKLGLVISGDMARGAEDFNDSLERMEMAAQGAAIQITQGILPSMTKSISALTEALAGMPAGIKAFSGSFIAIGTAATAAAVGVRMLYGAIAGLGPIGLAFVAVSALVSGVMALQAAEDAAHAAQLKSNAEEYQRVKTGKELVDAYQKEAAALEKTGISAKSRKEHEDKLKGIKTELVKLSPDYKTALDRETGSLTDQAAALKKVNDQHRELQENQRKQIQSEIADIEQRMKPLQAGIEKNKSLPAQFQPTSNGPFLGEINRLQALIDSKKIMLASLSEPVKAADDGEKKKPDIHGGKDPAEKDAMRKAQAAEAVADAKRQHELEKQNLEDIAALTEDAYKDGLIGLDDYLASRKSLIQMGSDAEIEMLQRQIAAEKASRDRAAKPEERLAATTKIADLENQIVLKRSEATSKLAAIDRKGAEDREKAAHEAIKLEAELEEAKGQTGEAALRAIRDEWEERRKHGGDTETMDELERQALLKKRVEIEQSKGQSAQAGLGNSLDSIDMQEQAGTLGPNDAITQRIAAYREYLGVIQEAALAQQALAVESGNPVLIAEADALIIKVGGLKTNLGELENQWAGVQKAGADALAGGMLTALTDISNGTRSVGDSFRDLGLSIAQSIQQAILKMILSRWSYGTSQK